MKSRESLFRQLFYCKSLHLLHEVVTNCRQFGWPMIIASRLYHTVVTTAFQVLNLFPSVLASIKFKLLANWIRISQLSIWVVSLSPNLKELSHDHKQSHITSSSDHIRRQDLTDKLLSANWPKTDFRISRTLWGRWGLNPWEISCVCGFLGARQSGIDESALKCRHSSASHDLGWAATKIIFYKRDNTGRQPRL